MNLENEQCPYLLKFHKCTPDVQSNHLLVCVDLIFFYRGHHHHLYAISELETKVLEGPVFLLCQ